MRPALLLLAVYIAVPSAHAEVKKKADRNAELQAVEKIVLENKANHPGWKRHVKEWDYDDPRADTRRLLITDMNDVPRIYRIEGGGEHCTMTVEYHYDSNGRLRFMEPEERCEPGHYFGSVEAQSFDRNGRKIRVGDNCDEKTPYSFCEYVRDPRKAFNARSLNGKPKTERTTVDR